MSDLPNWSFQQAVEWPAKYGALRSLHCNSVCDHQQITSCHLLHSTCSRVSCKSWTHLTTDHKCSWHYTDVIMSVIASQITSLMIVYSTVYSGADQRKHQSSASLAFVWGIHRGPVNSPHKWPVTRKMFQFDDVIMGCCYLGLRLMTPAENVGDIFINRNSKTKQFTYCWNNDRPVICIVFYGVTDKLYPIILVNCTNYVIKRVQHFCNIFQGPMGQKPVQSFLKNIIIRTRTRRLSSYNHRPYILPFLKNEQILKQHKVGHAGDIIHPS